MKDNFLKGLIVATILIITGVLASYYYTPSDKEYKEALLKSSGNPEYKLKNFKSIMGENELAYVIKRYDKHPEYYMTDKYTQGDQRGVSELTYRAGLHSHTVFSDGTMTPAETLHQAAKYADKVKARHPFEKYPMIIAITDHFNTLGCREAIDLVQKNPEKYKNLKIVLGMETEVPVKMPSQKEEHVMHMLVWSINPYEWPFEEMNFDDATAQWGEPYKELNFLPSYKDVVKRMQTMRFGLVGIAHPMRYFLDEENINAIIDELFSEFSTLQGKKILFTEGYYQPYRFDVPEELYDYTAAKAKEYGIYRTGSQDSHGRSIFSNN